MIGWVEEPHGAEVGFGIVVGLGHIAQYAVGKASAAVEGDGGPRTRHSSEDVQPLVVDGADNGEFVWGISDGTGPFVGDGVGGAPEGVLHFGAQVMGQEARGLDTSGFVIRDSCGVGSNHGRVIMSAEEGVAVGNADMGFHIGRPTGTCSGLGLSGTDDVMKDRH